MPLDDKAIIAAVGEVLAQERAQRVALGARVEELAAAVLHQPIPQEGRDGRDGLPGLQGERGEKGERGEPGQIGLEGPRGAQGEIGPVGPPAYAGRACGLWNETEAYLAMDVVVHNGSEWRAVRNDPGPLPGDGWVLGAKGTRGKPGERGEKGEKGDRGPPGPPGPAGLMLIGAEMKGYVLVLTLSDGSQLTCNTESAFRRYHSGAEA